MNLWKKLSAQMKFGAKETFAWRFNFIVDLFILPVNLLIYYLLWSSIYSYSGQGTIRGYTFVMLMTYFVIEMVTSLFIWTQIDERMSNSVRRGKLTQALIKPMSYLTRSFFNSLGGKMTSLVFLSLPILIIGFVFFGTRASIMSLWYIPVLILAYIINYFVIFITGTFSFWINKASGLIRIRRVIVDFVSGAFLPLTFFPLWFQNASWFLPFQYIKFIPVNVFIGKYSPSFILLIMLVQIFWIAVLYWIYRIMWKKGVDKYTGVGQ